MEMLTDLGLKAISSSLPKVINRELVNVVSTIGSSGSLKLIPSESSLKRLSWTVWIFSDSEEEQEWLGVGPCMGLSSGSVLGIIDVISDGGMVFASCLYVLQVGQLHCLVTSALSRNFFVLFTISSCVSAGPWQLCCQGDFFERWTAFGMQCLLQLMVVAHRTINDEGWPQYVTCKPSLTAKL